jgi:hypothetical protein
MLELRRNWAIVDGEKTTKALKFEFGYKWRGGAGIFSRKLMAATYPKTDGIGRPRTTSQSLLEFVGI